MLDGEHKRILFIGGFSRSGSTLLARMLGQLPGFFFAGELEFVWDKHFLGNQPCSCGRPFKECAFWKAVVREAYGSFDKVDAHTIQRLKRGIERVRYIPQLASPRKTAAYRIRLTRYTSHLDRLYAAIRVVSGSHTVVDSSKVPRYAYVLANLPKPGLRVIHLVRDSRAVAYSWSKRKLAHEVEGKRTYMEQLSPLQSSLGWVRDHTLTEPLRLVAPLGYRMVRYEDFTRDPKGTLADLLSAQGTEFSFLKDCSVELDVSHATEGNPMRFQHGTVELRPDIEWTESMNPHDVRLVTAVTLPLLMRYGYAGPTLTSLPSAGNLKT